MNKVSKVIVKVDHQEMEHEQQISIEANKLDNQWRNESVIENDTQRCSNKINPELGEVEVLKSDYSCLKKQHKIKREVPSIYMGDSTLNPLQLNNDFP